MGATLAGSAGRDVVDVFGPTRAGEGGRDAIGLGTTLAGGGVVDIGTMRIDGSVCGAVALTGTLVDSGISSQPASMSSSAGLAALVGPPRELPSAPDAITVRYPIPLPAWLPTASFLRGGDTLEFLSRISPELAQK